MKTATLLASSALLITGLNSWVTFQTWPIGQGGSVDFRSPNPGRTEIRLIPNGEKDLVNSELTILATDAIARPKGQFQAMAISGRKDSMYFQSLSGGGLEPLKICFDPRAGDPTLCLLPNGNVEIHGHLIVNGHLIR